jgi:selenocysteine lyase/cysteine desulfurase
MNPNDRRALFPVAANHVFLNHAAIAAPPRAVAGAVAAFVAECSEHASLGYGRWLARLAKVRGLAASLLGAKAGEIAFIPNTSGGLAAVAEGMRWRHGDEVLVAVPDFPANVYPWMHLARRGVGVRRVERGEGGRLSAAAVARELTPSTRLLAVSSVDYATGFAADLPALGALCRSHGVLLCVDAIQSLGALPLDVKRCGIHFLAAGGHKWLLGPVGTGLLFVDAAAADELEPPLVGWKSVIDEENFDLHFELRRDAARFEPGTLNLAGIFGLGAALELLQEAGMEHVAGRVLALTGALAGGLRERGLEIVSPWGAGERSGILAFRPAGEPEACFRHLGGRGVIVSLRRGCIRLSPHFYNDESDVAAFFRALDAFGTGSGKG